ncbi:MAG: efflux RND transporter periplasmic adaptor subunit [Turicibacter sp.]|nr:efflux RND transporter periplasmic adaptor subunit [Turicibacter sp.]
MRKLTKILAAALILPIAACTTAVSGDTDVPEREVPVNVATVATGSIRSELSFAGQVRAADNIIITSRVQGMVDEVFVNVGDFIHVNDPLFTMDAVDLQNNVNSLQAQLTAAETAVTAARTGVTQAGGAGIQQQILQASGGVAQAEGGVAQALTAIAQSETAVAQAQANIEQSTLALAQAQNAHDMAAQSHSDTESLFAAGVATRTQLDQAETGLTNAQIALEQANNNYHITHLALEQAQTSLAQAESSHAQAETALAQAISTYNIVSGAMPTETVQRAQDGLSQAIAQRDSIAVNLAAARERLDDVVVRSPISGVIGSRNVEPQTMLLQNPPPFTVVSAEAVLVNVEVTQIVINSIEPGQEVMVSIRAAAAEQFLGTVSSVSPAANEMTSTFTVEVAVDNSSGLVRPGMFAEVFFIRDYSPNTVIVPRGAVLAEDGESVVYLAVDNRAVRRVVTTGIDSGVEIEIVEGIAAGDLLIVTGQTLVTDGVSILIIE